MNDDTTSKEKGYSDDGFDISNQWSSLETRKKLMDPCLEKFDNIKIYRMNKKAKEMFKDDNYILTPFFNCRGINKITKVVDLSKNMLSFHLFSSIEKAWWTHKYLIEKKENNNQKTDQK